MGRPTLRKVMNKAWGMALYLCRARVPPPYPVCLMIEPTNLCNLRCPTCPTGSGKDKRPKGKMKLELFKSLIDEVAVYVRDVILHNYGEPFLHQDILKMIRYCASRSIRVTMSTNGHFFRDRDFVREIVTSGLTNLMICLDGASQETLSRFRVGAHFDKIVDGAAMLSEERSALGATLPLLELQFILMKHNQHEEKEVGALSRRMGMDRFSIKTVGIDTNDPDFDKLANDLLPDETIRCRYERDERGRYRLKGRLPNRCKWLYGTSVVLWDGTVVPCCYDLYAEHVMGNVSETKFKDIWNGDRYRRFREQVMSNRSSIAICNACPEERIQIGA